MTEWVFLDMLGGNVASLAKSKRKKKRNRKKNRSASLDAAENDGDDSGAEQSPTASASPATTPPTPPVRRRRCSWGGVYVREFDANPPGPGRSRRRKRTMSEDMEDPTQLKMPLAEERLYGSVEEIEEARALAASRAGNGRRR